MKRIFTLVLVIVLIISISVTVSGATPLGIGAKAAAMGGAFTAVADDGSAAYWNPAGINQLGFFTLTPGIGIYGSYDPSFDYNNLLNSTTFPPPIPDGNLGLPVFAGITTKYAGANVFGDISTITVSDSSYNRIYADGSIYGIISGAASFGDLMVGANYKIVRSARIIEQIAQIDPARYAEYIADPSLLGENWETKQDGNGYAVDIGIIYKLNDKLKLGFTGRNILSSVTVNQTKTNYVLDSGESMSQGQIVFKEGTSENSTVVDSLARVYVAGIAYRLTKSTLIAVDIEVISANNADMDQTRYHFGFEQTALWKTVALRLGAFTDKNESAIGLSAGLGFKLGPVLVDLAAVKAGESNLGLFATAGLRF